MEIIKNIYRSDDNVINDAFDRTIAEIHIKKQQNGYQSFMITGCEPGVGTTTIAINLATSMATAGWKTLLIDADMRKKTDDKRLGSEVNLGLYDYLGDNAELSDILTVTNVDHLTYLPSGAHEGNIISKICSSKMGELLHSLKEEYDYIIIDVPSMTAAIDASVMATLADATVLVTARGKAKKQNVSDAVEQLEDVHANVLGIIVNRVDKDEYRRVVKDYDYFRKRRYKRKKQKHHKD